MKKYTNPSTFSCFRKVSLVYFVAPNEKTNQCSESAAYSHKHVPAAPQSDEHAKHAQQKLTNVSDRTIQDFFSKIPVIHVQVPWGRPAQCQGDADEPYTVSISTLLSRKCLMTCLMSYLGGSVGIVHGIHARTRARDRKHKTDDE